MAKTIIQTIGPLYGDVVNGTVFGRPNGSVYVPSANTIAISLAESYRYFLKASDGKRYVLCNSSGTVDPSNTLKMVAESQDIANYIAIDIASDSEFTDIIGGRSYTAGQFNLSTYVISQGTTVEDLVADQTYYLRVILYAGSGQPVATSETIELVAVVLE